MALNHMHHSPSPTAPINNVVMDHIENGNNSNDSDALDSDSGLEVVEEPTLRPSELVRGNHNRTMSTISGKFLDEFYIKFQCTLHMPFYYAPFPKEMIDKM